MITETKYNYFENRTPSAVQQPPDGGRGEERALVD